MSLIELLRTTGRKTWHHRRQPAPSGCLGSSRSVQIFERGGLRVQERGGTRVIPLPPRWPNLNAYAERFVSPIKEECLDRMIFVGRSSFCSVRSRNTLSITTANGITKVWGIPSAPVQASGCQVRQSDSQGASRWSAENYYERLAAFNVVV